jgi:plastocyanin
MRSVKGARALASGMLVLAAICAVPAISAAQDMGTTATTTTTATTPAEPALPVDPAGPTSTAPPASGGPGAGTPTEPRDQSGTASPPISETPATSPGGGGAKARKAASASVNAGDFFFSSASVTIAVGDTVTWHNTGQAPHNATGNNGTFSTGTIDPGSSASHTFNSAGTFSYICTIHPNMTGTVRVLSSSSGGGGGGASSSGSGTSESSAVASPDAAGTSTTLPMTGMAVGALALVGAALLASGLIVRRANDKPRRRWLSIF